MPTIKTMTLDPLDRCLREEYGMKTSKQHLSDGLAQGVYPFGICIQTGKGRLFEIYEKKVREWADGLAT